MSTQDYAVVLETDLVNNALKARGLSQPSSEALTHAQCYQADLRANSVVHVHSPTIWGHADMLGLPATGRQAAYGTPELAHEVGELFSQEQFSGSGLFVMLGHLDGVVSFGRDVSEACLMVLGVLARALELEELQSSGGRRR